MEFLFYFGCVVSSYKHVILAVVLSIILPCRSSNLYGVWFYLSVLYCLFMLLVPRTCAHAVTLCTVTLVILTNYIHIYIIYMYRHKMI